MRVHERLLRRWRSVRGNHGQTEDPPFGRGEWCAPCDHAAGLREKHDASPRNRHGGKRLAAGEPGQLDFRVIDGAAARAALIPLS